jgi:type I restriction enzyme S subunit
MTQTVLLGDIARYITEKVSINELVLQDYVSTENLIADKGGLSIASNLPQIGKVTKFKEGDVLVSNIRPYFKKIWHASRDGGASNDVLVFRPTTENLTDEYLYYILKNDRFFDFSTASSGGSKMPRGDKVQIMKYPVYLPGLEAQKKIADILGTIDEKIELNRKMNETLEQMGQALFRHYFIDNPEAERWEGGLISDLVNIYSGYAFKRTDFDPDGDYGLVTIKNVQDGGFNPICNDFLLDLPDKTPDYVHLKTGDILLSLTGNVGRVCIVYGEKLLLNQRVAKLEGTGGQSSYAYFLFRQGEFKNKLISMSRGTAQLNLSPVETKNIKINLPPSDTLESFYSQAEPLMEKITENYQQIQTLTTLRDTLLPRLISGKVKV